jgi:hypothetical protein
VCALATKVKSDENPLSNATLTECSLQVIYPIPGKHMFARIGCELLCQIKAKVKSNQLVCSDIETKQKPSI